MDLTVNNNYKHIQDFGARLSYRTRIAIRRGINAKYKDLSGFSKKIADMNLNENIKTYKKILSVVEKFEEGTFSFYNESGLNSRVTKIDFLGPFSGYKTFNLPEDIQKEIKVVDKSNIFVDKYKIQEFPANRLGWLYGFFKNIKL